MRRHVLPTAPSPTTTHLMVCMMLWLCRLVKLVSQWDMKFEYACCRSNDATNLSDKLIPVDQPIDDTIHPHCCQWMVPGFDVMMINSKDIPSIRWPISPNQSNQSSNVCWRGGWSWEWMGWDGMRDGRQADPRWRERGQKGRSTMGRLPARSVVVIRPYSIDAARICFGEMWWEWFSPW